MKIDEEKCRLKFLPDWWKSQFLGKKMTEPVGGNAQNIRLNLYLAKIFFLNDVTWYKINWTDFWERKKAYKIKRIISASLGGWNINL